MSKTCACELSVAKQKHSARIAFNSREAKGEGVGSGNMTLGVLSKAIHLKGGNGSKVDNFSLHREALDRLITERFGPKVI
jgi:hypothetical protein